MSFFFILYTGKISIDWLIVVFSALCKSTTIKIKTRKSLRDCTIGQLTSISIRLTPIFRGNVLAATVIKTLALFYFQCDC